MNRKIIEGVVPGFQYLVRSGISNPCFLCGRGSPDMNLLLAMLRGADGKTELPMSPRPAICETCSVLAAWIWQSTKDIELPSSAFPTNVFTSLVLVTKDRVEDPLVPFDYLLVARKDIQNVACLPGGKVEPNETPEDAAVRELREETGLVSWPTAMEPLYLAYSPRGHLCQTFLCRLYSGTPRETETAVSWNPWPFSNAFFGHYAGYYMGLSVAMELRRKLQRATGTLASPLSVALGKAGGRMAELCMFRLATGKNEEGDLELMGGFSHVMTGVERQALDTMISAEEKRRQLPIRGLHGLVNEKPKAERKPKAIRTPHAEAATEYGEVDSLDGDEDENFVRGAPPAVPPTMPEI